MIFFLTVIYVLASLGISFVLVDMHFCFDNPSTGRVITTLIVFFLFWPLIFAWFGILVLKDTLSDLITNIIDRFKK